MLSGAARTARRTAWKLYPAPVTAGRDDGQPDLPSSGHAELPGGGQCDYLV
jgi:hypothetical protein